MTILRKCSDALFGFNFCKLCSALIAIALGFVATAAAGFIEKESSRALGHLDEAISKRNNYNEHRQNAIDSLRLKFLNSGQRSPELLLKIAESYTAFNNDSALHYLDLGIKVIPGEDALPFIMRQAALMPLDGDLQEALDVYNSIPDSAVPSQWKPLYYESGRQMYSYMAGAQSNLPEHKHRLELLALERQERLLEVVDSGIKEYDYLLGEYCFQNGDFTKARRLLTKVFEAKETPANLRARAAHHLSAMAREEEDMNTYLYYLTQAAITDVTAATREVAALQELGEYLYKCGDVDRAYSYLTTALASAVECGAPMRVLESSRMLPIIERARAKQIDKRETIIYVVVALLSLLIMCMIGVLWTLINKMKRLKRLQETLSATNSTREGYIGQFLNLCSVYMNKMNQFCKLTERKITAGKVDELLRISRSGSFIESQNKEFYEVFDNAFLHLYPDFQNRVNELLLPDKQIPVSQNRELTTELRILALMRMGITDSARIAQMLNFSINTIYAYRNRIKGKAIDRENFEATIRTL